MKIKTSLFLFFISFLFLQCNSDNGVKPLSCGFQGEVIFAGEWPSETEEIRIVTAEDFPPADIGDLIFGESLPVNDDTCVYTSTLEPGDYAMTGVAWKESGSDWALISLCGIYFSGADSLWPAGIVIPSDTSMISGIDMIVNRSKARRLTGSAVTGAVQFTGVWPDSFDSAVVVASVKDPFTESFTILDFSFSQAIPSSSQSAGYTIPVSPDDYQAVGVLFLQDDRPLTLNDLYYSQNLDGFISDVFSVAENETVAGPDFQIEIGPILSGVSGTIRFSGEWPAAPEEIRLIASVNFPPDFEELIIGDELPADADTYDFTFLLRPDTYKLIGAAWRAEGTNWDIVSVCGAYFEGDDSLSPGEIIIPSETAIISGVDIDVSRSKARVVTDTYIAGSIAFQGTWPEDITEARVIAATQFSLLPTILPSLFDLGFSGEAIAPGTESYEYLITAFPDTFEATGVIFFKGEQALTIDDILYTASVNGLSLTAYEVRENEITEGPDFTITF